MSSSTCCSQFLRGRPGGRFQSAAGGVLVWASIDSCSAWQQQIKIEIGQCSVSYNLLKSWIYWQTGAYLPGGLGVWKYEHICMNDSSVPRGPDPLNLNLKPQKSSYAPVDSYGQLSTSINAMKWSRTGSGRCKMVSSGTTTSFFAVMLPDSSSL